MPKFAVRSSKVVVHVTDSEVASVTVVAVTAAPGFDKEGLDKYDIKDSRNTTNKKTSNFIAF